MPHTIISIIWDVLFPFHSLDLLISRSVSVADAILLHYFRNYLTKPRTAVNISVLFPETHMCIPPLIHWNNVELREALLLVEKHLSPSFSSFFYQWKPLTNLRYEEKVQLRERFYCLTLGSLVI